MKIMSFFVTRMRSFLTHVNVTTLISTNYSLGIFRQRSVDLRDYNNSTSIFMDCCVVNVDDETELEIQASGNSWKKCCEIRAEHKIVE